MKITSGGRGIYHIPKNFQDGITIPYVDMTMSYGTFAQAGILSVVGFLIGFNIPISWKYRWFLVIACTLIGFMLGSIKINGGSLLEFFKEKNLWKANKIESLYNPKIKSATAQQNFLQASVGLSLPIPQEFREQIDDKYMGNKQLRIATGEQVKMLDRLNSYFDDDDYKPVAYLTKGEYQKYKKKKKRAKKDAKKHQKGVEQDGKAQEKANRASRNSATRRNRKSKKK